MPVARLRSEMPAEEFMRWGVYYARKAQREEMEQLRAKGK